MSVQTKPDFDALRLVADNTRPRARRIDGGAGSGDDGGMEARIAKLEAAVQHIERDLGEIKSDVREIRRDARADFRLQFGATIAVALGLAALMAKGFGWL